MDGLVSQEWLLQSTPSRWDGITYEQEHKYRHQYSRFMWDVGNQIRVPVMTVSTAILYLHRFYTMQSMKSSDRFIMAVASLFLACKVEETSKHLDVILRAAWKLRHESKHGQPEDRVQAACAQLDKPHVMTQITNCALVAERALLYAFGFQMPTYRVHSILVDFSTRPGSALNRVLQTDHGKAMIQRAFGMVVEGLHTTMCLKYEQVEIAWAYILFSALLQGCVEQLFAVDGTPLWRSGDTPVHYSTLRCVMHDIAHLYTPSVPDALDERVNAMATHGRPAQGPGAAVDTGGCGAAGSAAAAAAEASPAAAPAPPPLPGPLANKA